MADLAFERIKKRALEDIFGGLDNLPPDVLESMKPIFTETLTRNSNQEDFSKLTDEALKDELEKRVKGLLNSTKALASMRGKPHYEDASRISSALQRVRWEPKEMEMIMSRFNPPQIQPLATATQNTTIASPTQVNSPYSSLPAMQPRKILPTGIFGIGG